MFNLFLLPFPLLPGILIPDLFALVMCVVITQNAPIYDSIIFPIFPQNFGRIVNAKLAERSELAFFIRIAFLQQMLINLRLKLLVILHMSGLLSIFSCVLKLSLCVLRHRTHASHGKWIHGASRH